MEMDRYFLEIQYNGAAYHGWQRQPREISVQQVLEEALSLLLRRETPIVGSGRTDTGVHALQQYAHFEASPTDRAMPKLVYKLNSLLPEDISIASLRKVQPQAHARFDAQSRSYRYYVHQRKNPFYHPHSYYFYKEVDLEKMNEAARLLCDYKNFRAFSKAHTDVKTYNCQVWEAEWQRLEDHRLEFHIRANRFLRGMVRLITGALLDIGSGKMSIETLKSWMEKEEAVSHRHHAEAQGLYLCEVIYSPDIFLTPTA